MQVQRTIVPRTAPETSGTVSRMMAVSLPVAPFQIEVDLHRRDTAPRGPVTRLPARKIMSAAVELGVMDMRGGGLVWRNVVSAVLKRPWRSASPARGQSCQQVSAGECHTAPPMKPKSPLGETVPLESRALMLHNRNREAAERYLRLHQILSRGR